MKQGGFEMLDARQGVADRVAELERMYPSLAAAFDEVWNSELPWREVTSDYHTYRNFLVLTEGEN